MDQPTSTVHGVDTSGGSSSHGRPAVPPRKRSVSGTAGGLLSRLPFVRSSRSGDNLRPKSRHSTEGADAFSTTVFPPVPESSSFVPDRLHSTTLSDSPPATPSHIQQTQPKTRRRRGSLRKVALLGRGAQRERKETKAALAALDTKVERMDASTAPATAPVLNRPPLEVTDTDAYGLGISDITPRPSMDGFASRTPRPDHGSAGVMSTTTAALEADSLAGHDGPLQVDGTDSSSVTSPTISYSTTDDEDVLHISSPASRQTTASSSSISLLRPERASISSGSEGYFPAVIPHVPRPAGLGGRGNGSSLPSIQRRRSATQRAKSPLALTSLTGLSSTPLPPPDSDWDYSETEWWGWVVLIVTWVVFVTGMGSVLGIWGWAWDVGTTPYAPPELEDDPTLPISGYYPALMILTCIMAWVWVVVAWVGMKYFRHARVSGD